MNDIFAGKTPRIVGATVYALNRTHGLIPPREVGPHETVARVVDSYYGLIETVEGNVYSNGDFGIDRFNN